MNGRESANPKMIEEDDANVTVGPLMLRNATWKEPPEKYRAMSHCNELTIVLDSGFISILLNQGLVGEKE
ncbi:hypothetical protein Lal_00025971 [Lupinus albus]|nr:hypothetical protein Lal_00025971 [Lupinus albus]